MSATEGLTAVAAIVVRSVPGMLLEVSKGTPSIIVRLGQIERCVLWHLSLAEAWKLANDKKKFADATADGGLLNCSAGPQKACL